MARKNVLQGLMDGAKSAPDASLTPPNPTPLPRSTGGAVGAVSRSIADLKARSILDIDPAMIVGGGMQDRLETLDDEDAELRRSLAEYGQQVPVLVRPHPERDGYYQIVYGRRRVLAMRELGQPVKALVRDLDDQALVMAQGQENTLRRNLSYIEKANFARQMDEAGYDRKFICDAISVDKTQISRMLSVTERISPALIAQIGAAPGVGRERWLALADQIGASGVTEDDLISMINLAADSSSSDKRFQAAYSYVADQIAKQRAEQVFRRSDRRSLLDSEGVAIGQAQFDEEHFTLRLRLSRTEGFSGWLVDNLPILLNRYRMDALTRPKD
jgi:ParB family transcriptional regulator, chromosome partitioning protein